MGKGEKYWEEEFYRVRNELEDMSDCTDEFERLQKENISLQQQHQHFMKALDEGEIEKIIKEYRNTGSFLRLSGREDFASARITLAKAITDFIKSKLTGGV